MFTWISDQKSEGEEDGLEDLQEEEDEELVFKSDHEFSPESDLDEEDAAAQPRKHARTARAGNWFEYNLILVHYDHLIFDFEQI